MVGFRDLAKRTMPMRNWRTPFVILVAATLAMLIGLGVRMTFGIWLQPASKTLGWGLEELSFAMALQSLVWGVATPFLGAVADRYGTGRVVAFSGATYAVGLLVMANATTEWEAILGVGVLTGIAMGGCMAPILLTIISRAVPDERKRGIYVGIASSGGSSGQILLVPVAQAILDASDWQVTLVVLAGITALMVPLAVPLVQPKEIAAPPGPQQSLRAALREAMSHRGYVLLSAGYFVCGFQTLFISTHFPAMMQAYDVSPGIGAWAIALIGLFNVIGCFIWGSLGGRRRKKYLLCWIYVLRSILMSAFILLPITDTSVVVFAVTMGLVWLGTVPLTGAVVAQIFGVRYMATLFGLCFVSHQLGSFIGIWAGGWLYDVYGNYTVIWWAAVALGLVAMLFHYPIDDRPVARLMRSAEATGAAA